MSIRGIGDAYGVQRLLWLLVGTVVLPTLLLAFYGVAGLRYQQAALADRLRTQQEQALSAAARALFADVATVDAQVRASAARCAEPCALQLPGVKDGWRWSRDAAPPPALADLPWHPPPSDATVWYDGPQDAPLGIFELGRYRVAFVLDLAYFADHLDRNAGDTVSLQPNDARPGPAASVEEMLARRASVEIALERPLSRWRLVAANPEAALFGWSHWFYGAGLVVLVGLVLVGAFITLGAATREIRLSRLQTDFVSNVSHELRTPLTSIRMFVETLQSGRIEDPDRIAECLELLGKETDRLSRRIERVLGWARMESGRRTYEFETAPVADLVAESVAALRGQLVLEVVDVTVDLPEGLPPLSVDRDAIVEALVNLLQNAFRYTPPPRRIEVTAVARGPKVGITVSDNGPGIAPQHRRRIFEKFYQADNLLTTPSAGRGTGLGLAIVRAVVRAHGGRVELETEVGRGSRFTLWLPAATWTGGTHRI